MHRLSALIRRETFGAPYTPFRPLAVFAESPAWHIFAVGTSRLQTAPGAYSRLLSQGHFPCWLQNPEPEGDCFTSDSDTWHSAARRGEGARARLSIYHASMQASKQERDRKRATYLWAQAVLAQALHLVEEPRLYLAGGERPRVAAFCCNGVRVGRNSAPAVTRTPNADRAPKWSEYNEHPMTKEGHTAQQVEAHTPRAAENSIIRGWQARLLQVMIRRYQRRGYQTLRT